MYRSSVGADELVSDRPGEQAVTDWCSNVPPCIKASDYASVMAAANNGCSVDTLKGLHGLLGIGRVCTSYSPMTAVTVGNMSLFNPCVLKTLPSCGATPSATPVTTYVDEPLIIDDGPVIVDEKEDDDNGGLMVGGILAVLVVGGLGYAAFKAKKKRGSKRRKR